jgi:hypothetical protein
MNPLFAPPTPTDAVYMHKGSPVALLNVIANKLVYRWQSESEVMSYELGVRSKKNTLVILKYLWTWCRTNIKYTPDPPRFEYIRSPSQSYHDRKGDCDDYVVFCSTVLLNLGIRHTIRLADYGQGYQHIYIVLNITTNSKLQTIILDPVNEIFNQEIKPTRTKDIEVKPVGVPVSTMGNRGVGNLPKNDITSREIFLLDLYKKLQQQGHVHKSEWPIEKKVQISTDFFDSKKIKWGTISVNYYLFEHKKTDNSKLFDFVKTYFPEMTSSLENNKKGNEFVKIEFEKGRTIGFSIYSLVFDLKEIYGDKILITEQQDNEQGISYKNKELMDLMLNFADDSKYTTASSGVYFDKFGVTANNGNQLLHIEAQIDCEVGIYDKARQKIDEEYPDYNNVLVASKYKATMVMNNFIDIIKQSKPLADKVLNKVGISFEQRKERIGKWHDRYSDFKVSTDDKYYGNQSVINGMCLYDGPKMSIGVNVKLFQVFIDKVVKKYRPKTKIQTEKNNQTIRLEFTAPNKAIFIKIPTPFGMATFVQMPVMLADYAMVDTEEEREVKNAQKLKEFEETEAAFSASNATNQMPNITEAETVSPVPAMTQEQQWDETERITNEATTQRWLNKFTSNKLALAVKLDDTQYKRYNEIGKEEKGEVSQLIYLSLLSGQKTFEYASKHLRKMLYDNKYAGDLEAKLKDAIVSKISMQLDNSKQIYYVKAETPTTQSEPQAKVSEKEAPLFTRFKQYKAKYDAVLLFEVNGSFLMFNEDAIIGKDVLGLIIAKQGRNGINQSAGFDIKLRESNLTKLVKAGYKIVIVSVETPPEPKFKPEDNETYPEQVERIKRGSTLIALNLCLPVLQNNAHKKTQKLYLNLDSYSNIECTFYEDGEGLENGNISDYSYFFNVPNKKVKGRYIYNDHTVLEKIVTTMVGIEKVGVNRGFSVSSKNIVEMLDYLTKEYKVSAYVPNDKLYLIDTPQLPQPAAEKVNISTPNPEPKSKELIYDFVNQFNGDQFLTRVQLESFAKKQYGITDQRFVKEAYETAIVYYASNERENKAVGFSDANKELYDSFVGFYKKQANMSMRSSTSIAMQQYSTPLPIAFLMGVYMRNNKLKLAQKYLEPSAGNGLLTVGWTNDKNDVFVNELDNMRANNLMFLGFKNITQLDASTAEFSRTMGLKKFDGIVTNPPFGAVEKNKYLNIDGYELKDLDHIMTVRALDCLRDNGRAAIIIGGHTEWDDMGRIQKGKNRIFINYLYSHYNVEDVININGDLYSKMGTTFDIRLILVNGRKRTPDGYAPLKKDTNAQTVNSFEELWNRVFEPQKPTSIDYLKLRAKAMEMEIMIEIEILKMRKK